MSLAIHNARIWTADPDRPWARSVVIDGGVITAIDDADAARRADHTIDARDRVVTPGLIDTHMHVLMGGESLSQLDLSGVTSRAEFEQAISRAHDRLPDGEWLFAYGWSNENWPGAAMPDSSWLAPAGERPVVAWRMDSHVCLVNDAALRRCDLSRDPDDGRIDRDERGEPTGLMYEAAAWKIVNPIIPTASDSARIQALLEAQHHLHAHGLTCVQSMEYAREVARAYLPLRDRLTLRVRITLLDRDLPIDFSFGESFANDEHLAVIGYKTFVDGTLGSRTARMLTDYTDDPGNRGMLVELAARGTLTEWIGQVAERGFQPSIHAIGDEAARLALDAIESLSSLPPGEGLEIRVRPRIEHAQQLDSADIPRFRGVFANMQPLHRADDGRYAERRVGPERLAGSFAFRALLDAGAILAFGSDWPIVTCDPLAGMRAAITGQTLDGKPFRADQNLTVEETLRAYTIDAAYALRFEDRVGSIEIGKLGDLVILDRNPFAIDWISASPRIVTTIVGGEIVYNVHDTAAAL